MKYKYATLSLSFILLFHKSEYEFIIFNVESLHQPIEYKTANILGRIYKFIITAKALLYMTYIIGKNDFLAWYFTNDI